MKRLVLTAALALAALAGSQQQASAWGGFSIGFDLSLGRSGCCGCCPQATIWYATASRCPPCGSYYNPYCSACCLPACPGVACCPGYAYGGEPSLYQAATPHQAPTAAYQPAPSAYTPVGYFQQAPAPGYAGGGYAPTYQAPAYWYGN